MKRALKITIIVIFVVFAAIQFYRPDMTNPPIVAENTLEASTKIPEDVEKILTRSCADCHTNTTIYPWYSKVTPFNWLLANHISDGRRQLNLSEWSSYDAARKRRKLGEICEQIEQKEMPLPSYLWIHRDAQMSDADIKTLCGWSESEASKLAE